MIRLRQSTASQEVPLGHFVDDTDGKTAETGLTIANTDIKVWKAGATTLADKNSGGATHISGGIYYTVLDATDTNTIGPLVLFVAVSGALAVRLECEVLDEAVFDALFGTTALATATNITAASGVTVSSIGNGVVTAAAIADNAITAAKIADGAIDAATFAANAITATVLASDCITAAKIDGTAISEIQSGLATASVLSGVETKIDTIDTVVDAILVDTAEIGTAGAGLTNINLPDQAMNITGNITGNLSGSVGSVTGNVGGNVTGSVGSLATQAKADVNAEVVDCLNTDTYAEPGQEAPAATNTLVKKIGYLFKLLRNKITQTSTTLSIYDDAGTTVDQKSTVSDDGTTYTRGEIASGP